MLPNIENDRKTFSKQCLTELHFQKKMRNDETTQ